LGSKLSEIKDEKERGILLDLANQIQDLWTSGQYRAATDNPYAMPARVGYLAHRLGLVPSFNCKSGKDRTGVCDAEIKTIAAYIEANGKVPELHNPQEVDRDNFTKMHVQCGSREVLLSCTGVHGSKVPFMKQAFYNRFREGFRDEFWGVISKFGIIPGSTT
jgi:hypothetical protein